jgi:small conductance mechanosensitive channel
MHSYTEAFLIPLQNTLHRIVSFVPRLLIAIILFLLFYGLAILARRTARQTLERVSHIPWAVRTLIARSIYLLTLVIGILVALSAANVNVTTLIASLGVAGFALGFALKDILENFIAGILLLFARPFELEDQVTLGNFEGTVKDIQIRTTTLHTYNGDMVVIPNSSVFTGPVINHTRLGQRRYTVDFDTSLSADSAVVEREALKVVTENDEVAADPAPFLRAYAVDSGNDVLSWRLYYWAKPHKASQVKTESDTLAGIKRRLFDAGVPTPTSTSATILRRGANYPSSDGADTATGDGAKPDSSKQNGKTNA